MPSCSRIGALLSRPLTVLFYQLVSLGLGFLFRRLGFPETNIVLGYLMCVVLTARKTRGMVFGFAASLMATFSFNYFFTEPVHTFAVSNPSYLITFVIMTVTSIVPSMLTNLAQRAEEQANAREADTRALFELSRELTSACDLDQLAQVTARLVSMRMDTQAGFLCIAREGVLPGSFWQYTQDGRFIRRRIDQPKQLAAVLMGDRRSAVVRKELCYLPVYADTHLSGALVLPQEAKASLSDARLHLLDAMLETVSLALSRLRAVQEHIRSREAAERERERGNLLRSISHDLRTPLTGIMGTSEMLLHMSDADDPRRAMALGIYKEADWLRGLVENILSLTRLQEGRLSVKKQPEALEEIIGSAVAHLQHAQPDREISVTVPGDLLIVPVDARLMEQVLFNLLTNAVRHTPADGEIAVSASADAHTASITVSDRGSGIPPEALPHLFELFYTTPGVSADSVKGIGLGLTICRAIVRAHGGDIRCANRTDGPGAAFTVILPMKEDSTHV